MKLIENLSVKMENIAMILGLNPEHFSVLVSVFQPLFICSVAMFFLASATAVATVQRFKACRKVPEKAWTGHRPSEPSSEQSQSRRLNEGDRAELTAAQSADSDLRPCRSRLRLLANISHYVPQLGLLGAVVCLTVGFGRFYLSGHPLGISTVAGGIWLVLLAISLAVLVAIPTFVAHAWIENRIEPRCGVKTDTKTAPSGNCVSAQSACGN